MGVHIASTFTIDSWVQLGDADTHGSGPVTAAATMAKTYSGDQLQGTASGRILTTQGDAGASYVAQERITGALLGRNGSFVLEHQAAMSEGTEPVMSARIVAGSGTEELSGIWGSGELQHESLKLDVNFS